MLTCGLRWSHECAHSLVLPYTGLSILHLVVHMLLLLMSIRRQAVRMHSPPKARQLLMSTSFASGFWTFLRQEVQMACAVRLQPPIGGVVAGVGAARLR
jgi:hypothetical protein